MKVREVIRMIERDGWYRVRVTGSHRQFHHPRKAGTVTISGSLGVDMPKGTLNSVLRAMKQKPKYLVVIEREGTSFGAYVPDLPGCVAVARSLPTVRKLIREAIKLHLQDMLARGDRPPRARAAGEYVPTLA